MINMSYKKPLFRQQKEPRELFQGLGRSNEMLRQKARTPLGKAALDVVAMTEVNRIRKNNHGYDTDESRQFRLIAALPNYVRAQRTLDKNRDNMSRADRVETLQPVIEYNHILREMIDTEQYHSMSDVVDFIQGTLLYLRATPDIIQYTANNTRSILNGMRHEIAAESVLSSLPEINSVESAEAEDETKGKDIIIEYDGHNVAFDVKASENGARKAMANRRYHDDPIPIWSGFSNQEFGDKLILSTSQLQAKASYYRNLLDQIRRQAA